MPTEREGSERGRRKKERQRRARSKPRNTSPNSRSLSKARHEDDGIDPRTYFRPSQNDGQVDRKTRQLCSQVGRAVQFALSGVLHDPVLHVLLVERTEPAPDAAHMCVFVRITDPSIEIASAYQALSGAAVALRAEVAESIHRKRAPSLTFSVLPREATQ